MFVDLLKFSLFASCNLCYVIYPVKKEDILFFLFKAHGILKNLLSLHDKQHALWIPVREVLDSCEYGTFFQETLNTFRRNVWQTGFHCWGALGTLYCPRIILNVDSALKGLPRWCNGKESACQCRGHRDASSIPGSERSLELEMAIHSVFLPGKFHGQRSPLFLGLSLLQFSQL